jgi:hypothetical protein
MTINIQATVIQITEPKKLDDIFVTDITIERQNGKFTNYNLLKLFHKREDHGILNNANYHIEADLRGRKTKDGRVFNELKIVTIKEA